jgi:multidrug transporter EmrE-like cation transporter
MNSQAAVAANVARAKTIAEVANAEALKASRQFIKVAKPGVSIVGVIFSTLWLATAVNGYIAVTSNLNNKCNDTTVGVKIATNRTTRWYMVAMIVMSLIMLILSLMGVYHFSK